MPFWYYVAIGALLSQTFFFLIFYAACLQIDAKVQKFTDLTSRKILCEIPN
jgi:hypothetical protein